MRPRSLMIRVARVRGIAIIVALLLHSSFSPSASYSVSSSAAEAFCAPSHSSSSSRFSIRGVQQQQHHHHRRHVTRSRTRLRAESTIIDTTALLIIAGSGATATSSLAWWWWWWNDDIGAGRRTSETTVTAREFHPMTERRERRERRRQQQQQLAHIEPRAVPWTDEELQMYDGTNNDNNNDNNGGPILMAIKDRVFNVGTKNGRQFYGPNGEYHIMAGRDASRFLAKNILIEETYDERCVKLSVGEEANLEMWYWIIRNKYPLVGTYEMEETPITNK